MGTQNKKLRPRKNGRIPEKSSGHGRYEIAADRTAQRKTRLLNVVATVPFLAFVLTLVFVLFVDQKTSATASAYDSPTPRDAALSDGSAKADAVHATASQISLTAYSPTVSSRRSESSVASPHSFGTTVRSGVINRTLFGAQERNGAVDPILLKLSEIFGWDVDFTREARENDTFLVIYENTYGSRPAASTIVAAEFVNRDKVFRAIGFPLEDGTIAYFTPDGKRIRRTFLRSPIAVSSVSSPFSKSRFHPILNVWRAHTGVDYAAAIGTPVHATARGRVASIGWNGGYGKTIVLQHEGPYSTLYGHLSRYRRDLKVGSHVEQDELIGYVGQTGLATGPHLHYEFRVNGEHRDPLAFRPQEAGMEAIPPSRREEFLRVAAEQTARLDLYGRRQVLTATAK